MRRALPLLLLALVGCQGSREKDLVGTWKGPGVGTEVVLAADGNFKGQILMMGMEGAWKLDGDKVVLTPKTLNGAPAATMKAQLEKSVAAVPANRRGEVAKALKELDAPREFTLSADGKTLAGKSGPLAGTTLTKG